MKTNIICIATVLLLLSCNTKLEKQQTENGDSLSVENKTIEKQKQINALSLRVYKAFGRFETSKGNLYLNIPVPSKKFKIMEVKNVSEKNNNDLINAILVRVSDSNSFSHGQIIKDTLNSVRSIKKLNLNKSELNKDQELIVLTFNSVEKFTDAEIETIKKCISKNGSYTNAKACIDTIRKSDKDKSEEEILKPNDRDGSVIRGR